jgi:hypothetical protein
MESGHSELQKSKNALQREKDAAVIELRDQIAQISLDRDSYKRQYTGDTRLSQSYDF